MAKASTKRPEEKLRVVLSVLGGEFSAAAGRRAKVGTVGDGPWEFDAEAVVDTSDLLRNERRRGTPHVFRRRPQS